MLGKRVARVESEKTLRIGLDRLIGSGCGRRARAPAVNVRPSCRFNLLQLRIKKRLSRLLLVKMCPFEEPSQSYWTEQSHPLEA